MRQRMGWVTPAGSARGGGGGGVAAAHDDHAINGEEVLDTLAEAAAAVQGSGSAGA